MTATFPMGVLGPNGREEIWQLRLDGSSWAGLTLTDPHGTTWTAEGDDLFDALSQLRLQLEPLGHQVLCNGARLDAYPSAMARDAGGTLLYVLRPGRTASRLVPIFDPAEPTSVGTVAAQLDSYQVWLSGPKRRPLTERARFALAELRARVRSRY